MKQNITHIISTSQIFIVNCQYNMFWP